MNIHLTLAPLISLLAGILILMVPRLLNYIVAIYLTARVKVVVASVMQPTAE